jgi:hypothetical protein
MEMQQEVEEGWWTQAARGMDDRRRQWLWVLLVEEPLSLPWKEKAAHSFDSVREDISNHTLQHERQ